MRYVQCTVSVCRSIEKEKYTYYTVRPDAEAEDGPSSIPVSRLVLLIQMFYLLAPSVHQLSYAQSRVLNTTCGRIYCKVFAKLIPARLLNAKAGELQQSACYSYELIYLNESCLKDAALGLIDSWICIDGFRIRSEHSMAL